MTPFRRILVPHDFSPSAEEALELAARLIPADGRLLVLHVIVPVVPVTDLPVDAGGYIAPQDLVAATKHQLDRAIAKTTRGKPTRRIETKVVVGDPYQRIVAAARGMDAIVMSTAGRTGLSHLLIGSVAEKVVRHSPIPVLTLRHKATRRRSKPSTTSLRPLVARRASVG
jgi:nucleotide-binding universal stress UspA family protein